MRYVFFTVLMGAACTLGCPGDPGPSSDEPLPIEHGGTGATSAPEARQNLDAASLSERNVFTGTDYFNGLLYSNGSAIFAGDTSFQGTTLLEGRQIVRPSVDATNDPADDVLLEFRGVGGQVVAQVSESGVLVGNGSGLDELNASRITTGTLGDGHLASEYNQSVKLTNPSNTFSGNGAGLSGVGAVELHDLQYGATLSQGCTLQNGSLNCSACGGVTNCIVQPHDAFPEANWIAAGSYALQREGSLEVDAGRSLICTESSTGAIRLDLVAEAGNDPGSQPAAVIASTDVWVFPATSPGSTWRRVPQPRLLGRLLSEATDALKVGEAHTLYIRATVLDGAPQCVLGASPVSVLFKPMTGSMVAIDP